MKRPIASLLVRDAPHYRRTAFEAGLRAAGFAVSSKPLAEPSPADLLIIWNRYGVNHKIASAYEARGAGVIVAENGYLEFRGSKKAFALALNNHNGAGRWYQGPERRAHLLDVELAPWRDEQATGDVVLLPQRGIGPPGIAMPRSWVQEVRRRLQAAGVEGGRIRDRQHPAAYRDRRPQRSIAADLSGASCAVVWASGAGLRALCLGVPVAYEFRHWMGAPGGSFGVETVHNPRRGDREAMLERVAWASWTVEEVEAGVPFRHLEGIRR